MSEIEVLENRIKMLREHLKEIETMYEIGMLTDEVYHKLKRSYSKEIETCEKALSDLKKRFEYRKETQDVLITHGSYMQKSPELEHVEDLFVEYTISDTIDGARNSQSIPSIKFYYKSQQVEGIKMHSLSQKQKIKAETNSNIRKETNENVQSRLILIFSIIFLLYFISGFIYPKISMILLPIIIAMGIILEIKKFLIRRTRVYSSLQEKELKAGMDFSEEHSKNDNSKHESFFYMYLFVLAIVLLLILAAAILNPILVLIIAVISMIALIAGYLTGSRSVRFS